jgi:predicted permease
MMFGIELRHALRQLRRSPAFTLIVIATLSLCIGANTAIYSVLDAVLLRPVPYPEPGRLALVTTVSRDGGRENINDSQTGALFEAVRDGTPSLDVAALAGQSGVNFAGEGHLEFVQQERVSTGYFRVLGIPPQLGREFSPAEDLPNGPAVTILSYPFWQRVFRGEASVLGRAINLRGEPYTVIGIMPRDFRASAPVDVWTPLRPSRTGEGGGSNYGVVARLKPGATWPVVSSQLQALSRRLMESGDFPREYKNFEERIVPLQSGMTQDSRSRILLTWAAVLMVLVIGCVNIAGLMLARSAARHREIATRLALGSGRAVIVRQLLAESLLLALGGGVAGIALGIKAIGWLRDLGAGNMQLWNPIQLNLRVMAAMLGIAVLTSLLFGLAPAIQTSRLDIRSVLVEAGRGVAGTRRRWTRNVLVAAEVSLSLVLLVSAGLMVRTLSYLNGLNPGFDTRDVITAQASLQDARYKTAAAVNRLYTQSLERIGRIPRVQSAAVALTLPYERPLNDGFRTIDGDDQQGHGVEVVYVTPAYFDTLRIPLRRGRAFRDSDTQESAKVSIVSESFARKYYSRREVLGGHLRMEGAVSEIVGMVGDVQQHSGLGNFGPLSVEPTIYIPVSQTSDGFLQVIHRWFPPKWVIRGNGGQGALAAQVQAAVASVDPQLPLARFRTVDELRGHITREQRYQASLFSVLAGLAVLLAAIGLYGLISHSITQRTHELGIRMALGATAGQAMLNAMKPGIVLSLCGTAAGYGLSLAAVRFLKHMLWGVQPTDSATFLITAIILLLVAALASLVPALRILRLDPAETLRSE